MSRVPNLTYTDRAYRREKVVAAYKGGAKVPELAERYALSRNHIYTILIAAGMRRHTPRAPKLARFG
jgi:Mor family transcriptional regulator